MGSRSLRMSPFLIAPLTGHESLPGFELRKPRTPSLGRRPACLPQGDELFCDGINQQEQPGTQGLNRRHFLHRASALRRRVFPVQNRYTA